MSLSENERDKFYWLTIHEYDEDNLRIGKEVRGFCVGVLNIEAIHKIMHYPFYEEHWPSKEAIPDDRTLKKKRAERVNDMEKRVQCIKAGVCRDDCDMVYCPMREMFKHKISPREMTQHILTGLKRAAVTLTDELDMLPRKNLELSEDESSEEKDWR